MENIILELSQAADLRNQAAQPGNLVAIMRLYKEQNPSRPLTEEMANVIFNSTFVSRFFADMPEELWRHQQNPDWYKPFDEVCTDENRLVQKMQELRKTLLLAFLER